MSVAGLLALMVRSSCWLTKSLGAIGRLWKIGGGDKTSVDDVFSERGLVPRSRSAVARSSNSGSLESMTTKKRFVGDAAETARS